MNQYTDKKIDFYKNIIITDKQHDLVYTKPISHSNSGCYFKRISHKNKLIILEYINNKIIKKYSYSSKGNLSLLTSYNNGNKNYIITTFYDYSLSKKRIKEKRFYTNKYKYLKKEQYDKNNYLILITYFVKGIPYYKERFNDGFLISSNYYNEKGLKIV